MIRFLLGVAAGLLSAPAGLILAYLVGIVVTAANLKEFFATLLTAVTVLPLMLLLVLFIPTIIIGALTGGAIGATASYSARTYAIGAVAGLLFGELLITVTLPLIVRPEPGDFTSIVSHPALSGTYGLVLGLIAARFFRWFIRS